MPAEQNPQYYCTNESGKEAMKRLSELLCIRGAESLLIVGPGDAKIGFKNRCDKSRAALSEIETLACMLTEFIRLSH
jgi:hypothetical protein